MSRFLATSNRIASFDAIRAFAALFGIVLHVGASFMQYSYSPWPHFGKGSHLGFDILVCILHMMRVPVFFLLAGFFSLSLFKKLNFWKFIKNRAFRILIPFVICSILVNSYWILMRIITHHFPMTLGAFVNSYQLEYLWFLEYLLIYYFLFLINEAVTFSFLKVNVSLILKPLHLVLIFFALTYLFLYVSGYWFIPTFANFTPNIWLLGFYGCYFFVGVWFSKNYDRFESFFVWRRSYLYYGMVACAVYLILFLYFPHTKIMRGVSLTFYVTGCGLGIFCFISACRMLFQKSSPVITYLARASYWIYLAQTFFIVRIHPFTNFYLQNIFLRFLVTSLATLLLTLLSYHLLIRSNKNKLFS